MSHRRLALLSFVVFSVAISLYAAASEASTRAQVRTTNTLAPGSGFTPLREITNRDGTVATTWGKGDARVAVSGAPGIHVTIGADGVSAKPAPIDKSQTTGAAAVAAYAAAGRSVVKDAIAVGVDPVEAQRRFGNSIAPQGIVDGSTTSKGPGHQAPTMAVSGQIINSWCVSVSSADGKATTQACDTQYLDQDNGGGDWYLVDKQQASGNSTDTNWFQPTRLSQIAVWVSYSSGNQVIQWNPGSTTGVGACETRTYSISGQSGLGYSISQQVCPDSVGPYVLDTGTTNPQFGTTWRGRQPDANFWEGTAGVDLVHSPPGACNCPVLHVLQDLWRY